MNKLMIYSHEMGERMRWISVKDRLPEDDQTVLVFLNDNCDLMFYEDGLWRGKEYIDWKPTHWMPLPEPPSKLT